MRPDPNSKTNAPELNGETTDKLQSLIHEYGLPPTYFETIQKYHAPLANQVAAWARSTSQPLVLGMNGAQGTGKSTLAAVLALLLSSEHDLSSVQISLDDFYLPKMNRNSLAEEVHPLFATRGVPGTHDTALGISVLYDLKSGVSCRIPRFEKSTDDRLSADRWQEVSGPVDVVIFEGWCIGAIPEAAEDLRAPVNALEEIEDKEGVWRRYANRQLSEAYAQLFEMVDKLVYIKAPDFACIYQWRLEQENKLRARAEENAPGVMDQQQLTRFVMHYERLTRWMLKEMPGRSDIVLELAKDHTIEKVRGL